MILAHMAHDIYMSNLTLKLTQKLLLNFISTIVNNEKAVPTYYYTVEKITQAKNKYISSIYYFSGLKLISRQETFMML